MARNERHRFHLYGLRKVFFAAVLFALGLFAFSISLILARSGSQNRQGFQSSPATFDTFSLTQSGQVYEVNTAGTDELLVSDYQAGTLWQINAVTNVYTRYTGLGYVFDARRNSDGTLWWVDQANTFSRMQLPTGTYTTWQATAEGGSNLSGIAFDDVGRVWMTEFIGSALYRFDPASNQLCTVTVPGGNDSNYIIYNQGNLWFTTAFGTPRIQRLISNTNQLTSWNLSPSNSPLGIALDGSGNLWWADPGTGKIGEFKPGISEFITYTPPINTSPSGLIWKDNRIWYAGDNSAQIGSLDIATATGITRTASSSTVSVGMACQTISSSSVRSPTINTGSVSWSDTLITPTLDLNGWRVYSLTTGSSPYGIAGQRGSVWVTDQGLQQLIRLTDASSLKPRAFLPIVTR